MYPERLADDDEPGNNKPDNDMRERGRCAVTGPLAFVLFAVVFFIWLLEYAAVWLALVVGCACFGTGLLRLLAERAGRGRRALPGVLLAGGGLALCLAGVAWMAVQQRIPGISPF